MPRILFLTGKLAEPALRRTLADLAPSAGFEYAVAVLPITVVALATTPWIARHLTTLPERVDRVLLPGLCIGALDVLAQAWGDVPVERGPKDLRDLPDFFGAKSTPRADYGEYDIAILAEINHAPRLAPAELLVQARKAKQDGADLIDLGCDPGSTWAGITDAVRLLRDEGLRVSVDTFNVAEAAAAAKAGAELVLSVNGTNRAAAPDWGCEVVAVPDVPSTLEGLEETIDFLAAKSVPFRIDPVLEPIAFGFAQSLGRYLEVRRRWPAAEMLMGVGNLTELTDVDSAGVNVLLLGICQELGVRSVLTTEVINWARSSVRELDLARRLVNYACKHHVLPKRIEPDLVMLRDPKLREHGAATLQDLARQVTDRNFRLVAERGLLHVINRDMHLQGTDPFELFDAMQQGTPIDAAHAFYLGYELAKAVTALTLGKNYVQDEALRWGFLTVPEKSHRAPKNRRKPRGERSEPPESERLMPRAVCFLLLLPFLTSGGTPPEKIEAAGLHNILRVNDRLYSGSSPEGNTGFASLAKLGVKTVISVDGARPDVERAKKHGLRYVHLPIGYDGVPREQALRIARTVRDLPGPVYLHCHHGKHRGPAAAAAALLCLDDKCPVSAAVDLMKRAGTDPHYTGLHAAPKELRRPTKDELDRVPADFPAVAAVPALAKLMVGVETRWDRLKEVRGAGWKTPKNHPDLDPPHEALQLREHYREAARQPESAKKYPDDFRRKLAEAEAGAKELEDALRQKPPDAATAEKLFRRSTAACADCHAKYRDVPRSK